MPLKKISVMFLVWIFCFLPSAFADDRSEYPDVHDTAFQMVDPLDPENMNITQDYHNMNDHDGSGGHAGIDLSVVGIEGQPVYATASGHAFYHNNGGTGNCIIIDHGMGELITVYMHLSAVLPDIERVGDWPGPVSINDNNDSLVWVDQGQYIGNVGNTGNSDGAHLHLQIMRTSPFRDGGGIEQNPHDWLKGLPASTGAGYGHMSKRMKFKFDATVDFFKPVKVFIDKFGEISTKALELLAGVVGKVMGILFVIDFCIAACIRIISPSGQGNGTNIFTWLIFKAFLYLILIFFLTHWGQYVGNLSKNMFTGFGAMAFGSGGASDAMQAIANPFDIFQKGVLLIEALINNFISTNWVSMWLNFSTFIFTMAFAVAILFMLAVIVYQIALVYVEFYIMVLFSFATFMLAGIKQGRSMAARGVNGIFAVSLKLLFFSMFSLMLQGFMKDMQPPDYFTTTEILGPLKSGNGIPRDPTAKNPRTSGSTDDGNASDGSDDKPYAYMNQKLEETTNESDLQAGITDMETLMGHIQAVESEGHWHRYDYLNSGHYGAYQIREDFWPQWVEHAENWNHIELDTKPCNCDAPQTDPKYAPEPQTSHASWTHRNQYIVAKTEMVRLYKELGSYRAVAEAWNQGEQGRLDNPEAAAAYWKEVAKADPATGGFTRSMQIQVLQLITVIKIFCVVLLFMILGSRIAKLIDSFIQSAKGLKFTNND